MSAHLSAADALLRDERAVERVASEIDRFLDSKDWAGFRACFMESFQVDVELIGGAGSIDMKIDDFVHELQGLNGPDRVSFHSRSNTLVDVVGDTATLRGHIAAWNRCIGPEETLYEMWGSIEYGFRRDGEHCGKHWRVSRVAVRKWRESGQL